MYAYIFSKVEMVNFLKNITQNMESVKFIRAHFNENLEFTSWHARLRACMTKHRDEISNQSRQSVFNFDFFVLVTVSASRHYLLSSQSRSTICKLGNLAFDESIVYSSALACRTVLPSAAIPPEVLPFCRISSSTISRLISSFQFSTFP